MAKSMESNAKGRAWGLFLLAHTVLLDQIELRLSAAELPPLAWYDVLWELEKAPQGRLRMHELADRIVLSRYNLTRLADRIEREQLICREDCEDDRRGYFLVITPAGIDVRKKMWRVYGPSIDTLFSDHVSEAHLLAMTENFSRMIRRARQDADGGQSSAENSPKAKGRKPKAI